MRDHVFIIWSGAPETAISVKKQLEQYSYKCTIGGNADNNSTFSSVGDTVIQQMKSCNQAIVIFQNRADGAVSNNLFFELGYVLSMYGPKKVHCIKKENEEIILPSDFDNSFVEPLKCESEENFVDNIVKYFLNRQKMSITENKMQLINNRYKMHDFIQRHYSEHGSLCSDYELAQYILFYTQAGHMFGDEKAILKEFKKFKDENQMKFSDEMQIAVNMGIAFYEMITQIQLDEEGNCFIERSVFRHFKDIYTQCRDDLLEDSFGVFDEWARLFTSEHLTYAYNLIANNKSLGEEAQRKYVEKTLEWAEISMKEADLLASMPHIKENNDHRGLVSLLYAYVYRNLFICYQTIGDKENAIKYLLKTKKERASLKNNFELGSLDSKLHETFLMEYYLSLSECVQYADDLGLDKEEVEDYVDDIQNFVDMLHKKDDSTVYIARIRKMISE